MHNIAIIMPHPYIARGEKNDMVKTLYIPWAKRKDTPNAPNVSSAAGNRFRAVSLTVSSQKAVINTKINAIHNGLKSLNT